MNRPAPLKCEEPLKRAKLVMSGTGSKSGPCASGWGETPALLTFALHGARSDQY